MEEKITVTFINQINSFAISLDSIIQAGDFEKTMIKEKLKYFLELKQFVNANCNDDVKNYFNRIPIINEKVFNEINMLTVLGFLFGFFFGAVKRRKQNEIMNHLELVKNCMVNIIDYYRLNGKLD